MSYQTFNVQPVIVIPNSTINPNSSQIANNSLNQNSSSLPNNNITNKT